MLNKQFSLRLNQELDKMDFPSLLDERTEAFSKLIHIPRFKAESILSGHIPPEKAILDRIAEELEVKCDWLLGKESL